MFESIRRITIAAFGAVLISTAFIAAAVGPAHGIEAPAAGYAAAPASDRASA